MRYLMHSVGAAVLALTVSYSVPTPVAAQSVAGPYLAGRHAAVRSDFDHASQYYSRALARDPGNVELMESAALAYLSLGNVRQAVPLALAIEKTGSRSQAAHMLAMTDLIDKGDYAGLLARDVQTQGIGPWVDGLIQAWAQIGLGDVDAAMKEFDALSQEAGMMPIVTYHRALALASVGDFKRADALFASEAAGSAGQTRRGIMAHAQILSQLGRDEEALKALEAGFQGNSEPELGRMIAALKTGATLPWSHVPSTRAGMAEVFYTFAEILRGEQAGDHYTLLYARIARHLRADNIDALLLTAELLESLGQHELAIAEYKLVPADDPAYHAAELGRAAALRRLDKPEQAIEVLEQLTRSHGTFAIVHSTLGDTLSGLDRHAEAIASYDKALELADDGSQLRWLLHYRRAVAYERAGKWPEAEADFRAALEINPEQPQVLNYLGYSLVEKKQKLNEALDMIERAVARSPDSGYIVDSLGWVYYRLGRYDEAVEQMERAVELVPVDPVVNDHLGDVYWAVGRVREARFQWSRALSFISKSDTESEADPERIRAKLERGLDAVLAEEGAPPLKVADDN